MRRSARACARCGRATHVVLSWWYPCRRCAFCAAGRPWACSGTRAGESLLPDGTTRLRRASGNPVRAYLAVGTFGERTVVPATRRGEPVRSVIVYP